VAVKSVSPLFGYLGKAGSKLSTPDEGDTKLDVPGRINLTLTPPFPCFQLFSTSLPGGANRPVNSFIYAEEAAINAAVNTVVCELGPGVWRIQYQVVARPLGAGNDSTSTLRLDFVDILTAATVTLGRVSNALVNQIIEGDFVITVTADNVYSFARISVVGAGTGTSIGTIRIIASRLF